MKLRRTKNKNGVILGHSVHSSITSTNIGRFSQFFSLSHPTWNYSTKSMSDC